MRIDYNIDSENEEQKIYTFCGNLEKELLSIGVPIEHIEEMKKKNLKDVSLLNILCDRDLSSFEIKSVPVEKIVGVRRAFPNKSVFDNIKQFNEINGFDVRKMIDCLEYANKMQYKELLNSYSILPDPVDLVHIIDTDEYYLSDEHNHTTMCAMIFNAPFIKAKVYECHFNQKRIEKYHRTMNFYKEYDIAWIEKDANCNIKIVFNIIVCSEAGACAVAIRSDMTCNGNCFCICQINIKICHLYSSVLSAISFVTSSIIFDILTPYSMD